MQNSNYVNGVLFNDIINLVISIIIFSDTQSSKQLIFIQLISLWKVCQRIYLCTNPSYCSFGRRRIFQFMGNIIASIFYILLCQLRNSNFSVKISIPLENTGVSSVFATSVWPFSLIFSLARRNEGNFFQAVPTTLSSSLAEVRLASLVAWA